MNETLKSYVEIKAERAETLSFCRGLKLLHIRDQVEEILSQIGKGGIFEEYTIHNIQHIDQMLQIVEWLIPDCTKNEMTAAEWLMLTLAIYFHDLGMVVTKDEYEKRDKSSFDAYKKKILKEMENTEYIEYVNKRDDNFLYQEFVRENHAKRISQWITGNKTFDMGEVSTIKNIVENILRNLDDMFKADLAMICESHHKDDIDDFVKYRVDSLYGNDVQEKVNLNYIAIILRIADLLHITKDRTPSLTRRIINVSNPLSVVEWEKQKAVKAVKPKAKRDTEENINRDLEKDTIEITAYFQGAETAEAYFGLSSYLQYTRKELQRCNEIVEKAQKKEGTVVYKFPWREIDESHITVIGFETKKLSFTIAQENILQLLVGHTLYNDSSVVVRELVQNAIDAIRLQNHYENKKEISITKGKVQVDWDEDKRELCFWDNGTGMTIYDVENFLLKVGASKYREDSIKKQFPDFSPISHFGIGILTCFMIANDVDIITNSIEQEDVNCINLRKVNGSYLLRKIDKLNVDKRIREHGTMVKLYVRNDVDMSTLEYDLRKWIVLPEVPVYLTRKESKEERIGYNSLKQVLTEFLNDTGRNVDGEKFDVYEETQDGVTVAYAVRHLKYLSDWSLLEVGDRRIHKKEQLPIGTCVEGIRVEFSTPGYKNYAILAIANIKNSKYQTNVARSAIELDANSQILSAIYDVYRRYIQGQMDKLEQLEYSKSWAISEGYYLMKPLVSSNSRKSPVEPTDEEVLIHRLSKIRNIVLENDGVRSIVSAEEIYNLSEINIFESEMIQAAEYLLKQIKSDATLNDLIGVVCAEDKFLSKVNNVICNYDMYNILHQYALSNKDISSIIVDHKQRRIRLQYSLNVDIWYKFVFKYSDVSRFLYIPKEYFSIEGLVDEVGVKTSDCIVINSDTSLYDYIIKVINIFLKENTEENRFMLDRFLESILDSNILERVYKRDISKEIVEDQLYNVGGIGLSHEIMNKIWNKISMEEFIRIILAQNYTLYTIDNWIRKDDGI
ncbi:MAG: hypothetical protein HFG81_01680 [Dorea sp.]|jgi:Molecular chaperone, HSP90 family|nr:hypothetical protein [Dorea sp.]